MTLFIIYLQFIALFTARNVIANVLDCIKCYFTSSPLSSSVMHIRKVCRVDGRAMALAIPQLYDTVGSEVGGRPREVQSGAQINGRTGDLFILHYKM